MRNELPRNHSRSNNHRQHDIPIGDERLDEAEHVLGGLVDLDEGAVVDLAEAEELQHLAGLGAQSVDTGDY